MQLYCLHSCLFCIALIMHAYGFFILIDICIGIILRALFRELAGLAGEARQFSDHNSDISQATGAQPAKYLVIFEVLC